MGGVVNNKAFLNNFDMNFDQDGKLIGTIVAIYDVGCCIGALMSSIYSDRLGRRASILLGCVSMLLGAITQTSAYNKAILITGRVISGLGMGVINSTVPVLQVSSSTQPRSVDFLTMKAEMSVPRSRGRSACIQLTTLNFGIMLAYWIDYGFSTIRSSASWIWRVPIGLQLVFILTLIALTLAIPESPRWLIAHGHRSAAQRIFARLAALRTDDLRIVEEVNAVADSLDCQRELGAGSWVEVVRNDRIHSRERFMLACGIQMAQQLGGINALICKHCSQTHIHALTPQIILAPSSKSPSA